jgi:signal transduction histidine kinase
LTLIVFPIATGYAIVRYRLLNADYLLSRGTLYVLLAVIAATGYGLLVSGLSLLVGGALQPTNPYVVGLMVFILAVLFNPLRTRLQLYVDRAFFRNQSIYRDRLQDFSRELTQAMELPAIISLLRQYTLESLQPSQLHIFVLKPFDEQYIAFPDENEQPTTDIRFSIQSALVKLLSNRRDVFFWGDTNSFPKALKTDAARLALLGSQVFIPLPGRQSLTGWVALGPLKSGEPFSNRDLEFLSSLCDQAALAVERAQVVSDLERSVREMNVLTRIAQGINFTLAFDDILELIYAQTNQVIPTRDFRVTLFDKSSMSLTHTFYLEDDERREDLEHKPLSAGQGLEIEVIRSQQAILTDDYERECRNRSLTPADTGIFAWMGVPLNTGAETIGAISLASRDPAQVYVVEQLNLMQAIADQASGSIVKAKLLQESENRARQLAMLNEIGQSLVSTLELNPLLNQILVNASEIINCEAGSLFLVDPQTDELIFEVVIGPVASDLVGRRLPPGKGVVGEAVTARRAIIANDVRQNKEWFDKTDEQTGFTTQDLLVVPLQVKDRVIGVIELINKLNKLPFNQNDEELLTTFASQATIAIENARLYTMTDQALEARVDELSVMQRIDRDLNTSLDIVRAMQITLEWAMRHSDADAGLVGSIDEHGVRVMAAEGYTDELGLYRNKGDDLVRYMPDSISSIERAIRSGQTEFVCLKDGESGDTVTVTSDVFLYKDARSQVVVPIRREDEVIGILMLESAVAEKYPQDVIAFLTRLSDHAAIAIANAQLYAEVEAANLAKSKFVSFVAHELKNPMASIKGYTELVSGGMAGPVTDMQASFLSTVRTNVDRMNTIVSDLNDLTKIQVGSLHLDFKSVRVSDVVDESIRTLRKQIEAKEQSLKLDIPEESKFVWADPLRLGQILTNLISNAHKYSNQRGKIHIGVENCSEKRDSAGFEAVHIWVEDDGIGIPQQDQEKIFQQYFRTDISKETASGTGLGLNISKSLVEMQGGRIWFESEEGKGTTFHFTVPVAETT